MAKLNFCCSCQENYQIPPLLILVLIFPIFTTINFVTSQTDCVLDIQSSIVNTSNCTAGNWDGFLNKNCCGSPFNGYLHGLGLRANKTGQIFLNSTEQKVCITTMKSVDGYVSSCGIEKLTSGAGGCSDYSVTDVVNELGYKLTSLDEDCHALGLDGESSSDRNCSACLARWEEIRASRNISPESVTDGTDVCRFALLVSLTSQRIYEEKWLQAIYKCLGEKSIPIAGQGRKKQKRLRTVLLIGGLAGITVITIVVSWILYQRSSKTTLPKEKEISNDSLSEEPSYRNISVKQVYSATNNLSEMNFIGQGLAGKVYKGILSNGQHVAVKHIINDGEMDTFVREVTNLSHVRHPNLVTLLGHCEGDDECFLIYELCQKGNLSEWLFGKQKTLSWIQRLEIAIDCARGLWFLHTYPEGCIVHRDIKPTNILLCANFQGKLSDFGLSKVMDMGQSYVSSEVRGTFGYVDPEYQKNSRVNSSGDVYSFGIVLLQLISGQRVINMDVTRPMPLGKMAKILTRGGKITEFSDPKLNGEYAIEAFELVLKLALSCSGIKQQRPSMAQVVEKLEKALDSSTKVKSFTPPSAQDMA